MKNMKVLLIMTALISAFTAMASTHDSLQNQLKKASIPALGNLKPGKSWDCQLLDINGKEEKDKLKKNALNFNGKAGLFQNIGEASEKVFTQEADGLVATDLIERQGVLLVLKVASTGELLGEYSVPANNSPKGIKLPDAFHSEEFKAVSYIRCK